jgi:ATP-dependent DNA helicase MPH1
MIRASVFVGQADSKRSEGMNQAKQQETISKFQKGIFNVLVATSIGEEGLDIGQVDLIVCYDASGSPIRMLQRMGRTGRKRAGNIVLLLMRGKEEESFMKAKDNYEQMQKMISSGERFAFRHDLSVRIIPRDVKPVVEKRIIEIPFENTQDQSLPEPKRRSLKAKKKPPKKFHIPDGVETGFQKASRINEKGIDLTDVGATLAPKQFKKMEDSDLTPIPLLESVLLGPSDTDELRRRYQHVPGLDVEEVEMPGLNLHPFAQRSLLSTGKILHGGFTKKCVRLFQTLGNLQRRETRFWKPYGDSAPARSWSVPLLVQNEGDATERPTSKNTAARVKRGATANPTLWLSGVGTNDQVGIEISTTDDLLAVETTMMLSSDDESGYRPSPQMVSRCKRKRKRVTLSCSQGEGDDLAMSETFSEDSEDGESLKNFLAADEEEIPLATLSSSQTLSSPIIQKLLKPVYKPTPLILTQDSIEDDELPDIGDIVGKKTTATVCTLEDRDTGSASLKAHRGKRRRMIVDDSDE